jgi:glycosyltransferase involved in cell wall biosynthesis
VADLLTSIVLPVHNQADHLDEVVGAYLDELDRHDRPYELVLSLNGCRDRSGEVAASLAERRPEVRWLEQAEGGWGRAVRAGLAEARGDLLCYANSARTAPPMLTLMLVYATAYPKVVLKANRTIRDSWQRRLGSLLFNLECRALFNLETMDVNGTPKVFPRSFSKLLELTRNDDLIDVEFMDVCRREGYPLIEVPILATVRHGGESTTSYRSALGMYVGAYKLAREFRDGGSRN